MPIFNYKAKEIIVKIVYYGPGLCGKTTSLQYLHQQTISEHKGELYFLATETDQTIYFELLPLYVGEISSFKLRFQVYTVPGQVKYNNTRKAVLQGVDAIVFVADSQRSRQEANQISFKNLHYNLKGAYNIQLEDVPLIYEYNKRDMGDILSVAELNQDLNPWDLPYFETVATTGEGVSEAFEAISLQAIRKLEHRLGQLDRGGAPPTPSFSAQPRRLFKQTTASDEEERLIEYPEQKEPEESQAAEVQPTVSQDKELSYVDLIAENYEDGQPIFEEGEFGDTMYFIEEGKVKIVGSYKHTRKVVITYEKGDFFGEMALFGGKARSARAVAVGNTRLLPVTKETLASQIQKKPEIALALLETLSNRIRNNTKTISRLADQNKELLQHLKKAQTMMKQLKEQNEFLRQQLEPDQP